MIVNPIVGIIPWTITIVWTSTGLGGVTYWFWGRFIAGRPRLDFLGVSRSSSPAGSSNVDRYTGDSILFLIVGVVFPATLPFVTRGLTWCTTASRAGCCPPSSARSCASR